MREVLAWELLASKSSPQVSEMEGAVYSLDSWNVSEQPHIPGTGWGPGNRRFQVAVLAFHVLSVQLFSQLRDMRPSWEVTHSMSHCFFWGGEDIVGITRQPPAWLSEKLSKRQTKFLCRRKVRTPGGQYLCLFRAPGGHIHWSLGAQGMPVTGDISGADNVALSVPTQRHSFAWSLREGHPREVNGRLAFPTWDGALFIAGQSLDLTIASIESLSWHASLTKWGISESQSLPRTSIQTRSSHLGFPHCIESTSL